MDRGLRKRHTGMWVILTVLLIVLVVYSYLNIPEFPGDEPIKAATP